MNTYFQMHSLHKQHTAKKKGKQAITVRPSYDMIKHSKTLQGQPIKTHSKVQLNLATSPC